MKRILAISVAALCLAGVSAARQGTANGNERPSNPSTQHASKHHGKGHHSKHHGKHHSTAHHPAS